METEHTIPHLPLTPTECWQQRVYILEQAEKHEACEDEFTAAKETKNGNELLLVVTKNCGWLNSHKIFRVERFPDPKYLTKLEELYASGCTSLTAIEAMDNLWYLDVEGCTKLEKIEAMDNLWYLDARGCTNLKTIEAMDNLEFLYAEGCTKLEKIKAMDQLVKLYARNCTKLKIKDSDFPNATIYR